MNNYLLSIVIPTKNRQYYCLYAVKQILSLGLPNLEICIQDNSDKDELRIEIEKLKAPNIVYNYHDGVLSFVDNFSEAISISHGEYLCMIGDDDGILSNIIEYVEKAKSQKIDAIIPSLGFVYFWPSKEKIVENAETGLLHLWVMKSELRLVNPEKALNILLHDAAQNYTSLDIPRLYHGIVRKDILESIKKKTGVYFGGLTPDMYMAVALALECKKVIRINESVTISGICSKSGSADSATGRHTGDLSEAPHFRGHLNYIWNERIPSFYSVDTIWAETLLHALASFKRNDLINKFNLPLFEEICFQKYPEHKKLINDHFLKQGISPLRMKFAYLSFSLRILLKRIIRKLIRETKVLFGYKIYVAHLTNISDIVVAEKSIEKFKRQKELLSH